MKNPIISELKDDLIIKITGTVELTEGRAEEAIELALHSIKDVLDREKDEDERSMLRLFSPDRNTKGAVELHHTIETVYLGRLADSMALSATQAEAVKTEVLPVMISTLKKKANGDAVALKEALSIGSFTEMVGNTTERIGEMAGSAGERIGDAAGAAREKISEVADATKEKFEEVSEATKEKLGEVSEATKEKLEVASEVVKEKWSGIKKLFRRS